MTTVAAGRRYIPSHVMGITCWCRPRVVDTYEWGQVWLHRNVILRPDTQQRAFQSILHGPPVP